MISSNDDISGSIYESAIIQYMDNKIEEFLNKQRVCSLTTLLKNGSPHSAAMHYSHTTTPFEIYIQTENSSKKCEALLPHKSTKASIVIGFDEKEFKTLQLDGDVKLLSNNKLADIHKIHYKKHPGAKQWKDDPATVFLVFKPTWWRYTEYKPKFMGIESK